jgi:hypothetical protein
VAFRLYPNTRFLYLQVAVALRALGATALGGPLLFDLFCLYISGLILLDKRQNCTRITKYLPGRYHDALNRLLRVIPLSTRVIMDLLITLAKSYGLTGYLSLDDVAVEKRFSKKCPWTGWIYSGSKGGKVYGLHIVVLLWCVGIIKIPVSFRLWQPKDKCGKGRYRTKVQLAQQMMVEMQARQLPFAYLVFDSWYNARWFTRWLDNCGIIWQSTLAKNSLVVYKNKKIRVDTLARTLKLKWRSHLELRTAVLCVYLPGYGSVRLVVTKDGHGRWTYIVTNDMQADVTTIVQRKRSRWNIETLFRDGKQFAGLGACQCRVPQAMVRHVAFVLLAYVVLSQLKLDPSETVGEVKERLQLHVVTHGTPPPPPLKGPDKNYVPTA